MQLALSIWGSEVEQALQVLRGPESGLAPIEDSSYTNLRKPLHSDLGDVIQIVGVVINLVQLAAALYALKGQVTIIVRRDDRELRLSGKESREDIEQQLAQLSQPSESDRDPRT